MCMVSSDELRRLRNDVPVAAVIDELHIERARRGTRLTFCCPQCGTFHTAVNRRTNLARCCRCERNYNPIDLVMATCHVSFLDVVRDLRTIAARARPTAASEEPLRIVET